ncbi:MAG: hypothetical protein HY791_33145 [Deltaproteobacteria bacterium]|nr:hypothetical protein [Deltaproteobacteria bacterium]
MPPWTRALVFMGASVACGPSRFAGYEAGPDDLAVAIVLDQNDRVIKVAPLDPDSRFTLELEGTYSERIVVLTSESLRGLDGRPFRARDLVARRVDDLSPDHGCGRCPEPEIDGIQAIAAGYACPIPSSARIFGDLLSNPSEVLASVLLDAPGSCVCRPAGPDERVFEARPIDPPGATQAIEGATLTIDGRIVAAGRHLFVWEAAPAVFEVTAQLDLFEGNVLAMNAARPGEVAIAFELPAPPRGRRPFELVTLDPSDRRVLRTASRADFHLSGLSWLPDSDSILLAGRDSSGDSLELCGRELESCHRIVPNEFPTKSIRLPAVRSPLGWELSLEGGGFLRFERMPSPSSVRNAVVTAGEPELSAEGLLRTSDGDVRLRWVSSVTEGLGEVYPVQGGWVSCANVAREVIIAGSPWPSSFDGPIQLHELYRGVGSCRMARQLGAEITFELSWSAAVTCSIDRCERKEHDVLKRRTLSRVGQSTLAFDARSVLVSTSSSGPFVPRFGAAAAADPVISIANWTHDRLLAVSRSGLVRAVTSTGEVSMLASLSATVSAADFDSASAELVYATVERSCSATYGASVYRMDLTNGAKRPMTGPDELRCTIVHDIAATGDGRAVVVGDQGRLWVADASRLVEAPMSWDDPDTEVVESTERADSCSEGDDTHPLSELMSDSRMWLDASARRGGAIVVGCDRVAARIDLTRDPPQAIRWATDAPGSQAPAHPLLGAVSVECADTLAIGIRGVANGNTEHGEIYRSFQAPPQTRSGRLPHLLMRRDSDNDARAGPGFSSNDIIALVGRANALTFVFRHSAHRVGSKFGMRFEGTNLSAAGQLDTGETLLGDELGTLFFAP